MRPMRTARSTPSRTRSTLVSVSRTSSRSAGWLLHQPLQQRHHEAPAVVDGQFNAQRAGRRGACARGLGLQVLHLGQHALATLEKALAVRRQRDLPRRAVEELHAQRLLQPRHGLGQRRRRDALLARRRSKAAVLGRLGKGDELLQTVHGGTPRFRLTTVCRQCYDIERSSRINGRAARLPSSAASISGRRLQGDHP